MKKTSVLITIQETDLVKDKLIILKGLDEKIILAKVIDYEKKKKSLTLYSIQFGDGYSFIHTFDLKESSKGIMTFKRKELHLFGELVVKYTLISVVSGHLE